MFTETISCWLITLLFFQYLIYQNGYILDTEVTDITTEKQPPVCPPLCLYPSSLGPQAKGRKFCPTRITTACAWWRCNSVHGPTTLGFFCLFCFVLFFCVVSYNGKQHVHKQEWYCFCEVLYIQSKDRECHWPKGQWTAGIVHPTYCSPLPLSYQPQAVN